MRLVLDHGNVKVQKISKKIIKTFVDNSHSAKRLRKNEEDTENLILKPNRFERENTMLNRGKSSSVNESVKGWIPSLVKNVKFDHEEGTGSSCSSSVRKILWYDLYHNNHGVRNKAKAVDFNKCECKCVLDFFVFNDTSKTYGPFEADGVLMQLNKLRGMGHPPLKRGNQVFVILEREATPRKKIPILKFQHVFNWTMTYRQDSDIFYPYGQIVERTERSAMKDYTEIFRKKKHSIVWFVSHCKTRSKREDYVKELQKYIEVDIYGGCGSLQCPRHGSKSKACNKRLVDEYFFRIAFDNTFHRDYVTEKLFEHFPLDMIQLVRGSSDYKYLPEGTVIDVKNFSSPEDLAQYLKTLMNDKETYTEFLRRKENYYAQSLADQSQKAYCQLCKMLHNQERYRKSYASIADWWDS